MHDKLLVGTEQLPEEVKTEIKALTNGVNDDIEKARIVYQYMQNKTNVMHNEIFELDQNINGQKSVGL